VYKMFNPNPTASRVGDCVIRAVCAATGETWEQAYIGLCLNGYLMGDLPSANNVWGAYLREKGFIRRILPATCPDCYTVERFANEHPTGVYVLSTNGHVVTVRDGDWYDVWDSGDCVPVYYWTMEE